MYLSENIKLLRKRKARSQEEVSNFLGVKRSAWSSYETGAAEPGLDLLLRISDYFKISIDKLVRHDLSKVSERVLSELEKGNDIDVSGKSLRILATTIGDDNEENIELVPVKARAGYSTGFSDPDYIKVLPAFRLPFLDKSKKYRTFPISGDSMPPVPDGSWITGEYLQNWNQIKNGQPYIVITRDEGIVFKMVYNKIKEHGTLLLCSTNPLYKPYEIEVGQVVEIWKFVNYISSELPETSLSKEEVTSTILSLQREMAEVRKKLEEQNVQLNMFR